MSTVMAKKPADDPKKEAKPGFTTFRVFLGDGQDMSDLSGLEGRSAAEVYAEHCAPVIREVLRKKMTERLKRLS